MHPPCESRLKTGPLGRYHDEILPMMLESRRKMAGQQSYIQKKRRCDISVKSNIFSSFGQNLPVQAPFAVISALLERFYQEFERCESIHGQAERLLDSAREMEDSISVNLSSRRLEVSRVELLLQVATFCVAVGALVAGIFGMNLKSYLEEQMSAFWLTTAGIIVGAMAAFFIMYSYFRARRIL